MTLYYGCTLVLINIDSLIQLLGMTGCYLCRQFWCRYHLGYFTICEGATSVWHTGLPFFNLIYTWQIDCEVLLSKHKYLHRYREARVLTVNYIMETLYTEIHPATPNHNFLAQVTYTGKPQPLLVLDNGNHSHHSLWKVWIWIRPNKSKYWIQWSDCLAFLYRRKKRLKHLSRVPYRILVEDQFDL